MSDYSDVIARLHHAFRWDCDGCGRENFVRAISLEQEYIESKFEREVDDDGQYILYPAIVVCEKPGRVEIEIEEIDGSIRLS